MPVIALLTDFGTRDHYVGTMKGVMLDIAPQATLVDISHEIAPQDILGGAFQLASSYRYFPRDTIFVAVVDPGVGSVRRGIAAEAGGFRFVAPDNGLLTLVFRESPPTLVVELRESKFALPIVSHTFEGRDRFGPAAAWLATGIELAAFGPIVTDYHLLDVPEPTVDGGSIHGVVLAVDRFGNLVTNIPRAMIDRLGPATFTVGGEAVSRVVATYAQMPPGEVCALFGSSNYLEFAINTASAAGRLHLARGAKVEVRRVLK